jgi:formylglycine-generating enzyme required for sulfatase activity
MIMIRLSLKTLSLGLAALACLLAATAGADTITYEMVTVGNPGNANDPEGTGNGQVDYSYQIGKYDVTIGQYTDFLNAVAKTDTYSLYNASMETDLWVAGISRAGLSGAYVYSVIGPSGTTPAGASSPGNRPITYVSWFDAARFANWMANGQPTGAQSSTTTENGAYNVNGATSGDTVAKNVTNPNTSAAPTFSIPTVNEWYKAAYYDPTLNGGTGGYYAYATQSNVPPGNIIGSAANQANWNTGSGYSVTQVGGSPEPDQNYLTDVGAFSGSGSFYGTFDQSGNVDQWNDLDGVPGSSRGKRGGWWYLTDPGGFSAGADGSASADTEDYSIGFRLAGPASSPSSVPEIDPNSLGSVLALVLGSLGLLERRRLKAA